MQISIKSKQNILFGCDHNIKKYNVVSSRGSNNLSQSLHKSRPSIKMSAISNDDPSHRKFKLNNDRSTNQKQRVQPFKTDDYLEFKSKLVKDRNVISDVQRNNWKQNTPANNFDVKVPNFLQP